MRGPSVGIGWARSSCAVGSAARILFPLLTAVACGGEVSHAESPLEKAAAHKATARCEKRAQCAGAGATLDPAATETCIQVQTDHQLRRSATEGLPEDVQMLTACARSTEVQTCDDYLTGNTPGCSVHGTKTNGQTCLWDEQCQSGFCTGSALNDHCGTCSPQPAAGDPCVSDCGLLFQLPLGVVCVSDTAGARQCVPLGSAGTSCDSAPCETDLICTPSGGSTKTCSVPSTTFGDACSTQGPFCDSRRGLYCNSGTHSCELPRTVSEGETCGAPGDGSLVLCDARTYCSRAAPTDPTGTCVAASLPDGFQCQAGSSAPPQCEFPAICAHAPGTSTGTCQIVDTESYCSVR